MASRAILPGIAGIAALFMAGGAHAEPIAPDKRAPVRIAAPPIAPHFAAAPRTNAAGLPFAAASDAELGAARGQGIIVTNQTLTAITSGNVIGGDYVAGNVSLGDNALQNFNGVGNLLINTGAQVSLQTGMNITINVGG